MIKAFYLPITLLLLMVPCAQASDEEINNKLQRLLAVSGFTEQIYQFPNVMKAGIASIYEMKLCDENSFNIITASIKSTITPKYINQVLRDDLKTRISEDSIDRLLAWYDSPQGKKIAALEIASSKTETYAKMKQVSDSLFADEERVGLARKINAISNGTDWAVNIEMQSKIAMLSALAQIQHKNITPSLVQLASQLEEQKIQMRPHVEKAILLWYLYTYQSLDEDEIKGYLNFLKTDDARKFNEAALDSLAFAITGVTENFLLDINETARAEQSVKSAH